MHVIQNQYILRFHVQPSGESLTAQQPDNNIVRCCDTIYGCSTWGAQSLHTIQQR